MRVLIVSTNRYARPAPVMPLGACIAAEAAERAGHSVELLDMMFLRSPIVALERDLRSMRPDVVGLSIRNIDNNDMINPGGLLEEIEQIVDVVRRSTPAPIVIGGSGVGVMPEELLRKTGASWAVHANGEIVFPRLLSALARGENPRHISGVGWIEGGGFHVGHPTRFPETIETEEIRLDPEDEPEHLVVWRPISSPTKRGGGTQVIDIEPPQMRETISRAGIRTLRTGPSRIGTVSEPLYCLAPDYGRWINTRVYKHAMATAPIQTKRGCPFECVYCTYSLTEGHYLSAFVSRECGGGGEAASAGGFARY